MQATEVLDKSVLDLAESLREMLGCANAVGQDLLSIPNTTNVVEEISRHSIQVASLIHEYIKLPLASELFLSFFSNHLMFITMI